MRERGADAAAAVVGVDGGVAAAGGPDLGVRDQPVAVEDADGRGGDVEAGPAPVADDVGLLDHHLAEVGRLLGGHHLEDRVGVVELERAGGEAGGKVHAPEV